MNSSSRDLVSCVEVQRWVSATYADRERRTRMSVLNVARMGKFSPDRSIRIAAATSGACSR